MDMNRLIKDWIGRFKITKTQGNIVAIEMRYTLHNTDYQSGNDTIVEIEKIYPYPIQVEYNNEENQLELIINVKTENIPSFLKLKKYLVQLNNSVPTH